MENSENAVQPENQFVNNPEINDYLGESARWGKFLSILGFVGIGLMLASAFFFIFIFSPPEIAGIPYMGIAYKLPGFFIFIFALIYFFPVYYLYMFSVKTSQGISTGNITATTAGFRNLKSMFKFLGVLALIILSIYAIILMFTVPVALLSAF